MLLAKIRPALRYRILGLAALLWTGCTGSVTIRVDGPTLAPPAAPVVTATCEQNQYLRGGKHVYRSGRWVWIAPTCVARGTTWRAGCRWIRGSWGRRGNRRVFTSGRRHCPAVVARPLEIQIPEEAVKKAVEEAVKR